MQGIFHPGHLEIHQGAARLLEQLPHTAVIKSDGGEIEASPDSPFRMLSVHDRETKKEEWPQLLTDRELKPKIPELNTMKLLWQEKIQYTYGKAAVINTLATTLSTMKKHET